MKVLKAFLAVVMLSCALLAGSVSASEPVSIEAQGPVLVGSKLPGGPDVGIQGFFDPSFDYLSSGYNSIQDNGNQTITIYAYTYATEPVQLIGTTIYFDKWNGNSWVQLNYINLSDVDKQFFGGGATFYATSGYYYRARTVHWVYNDGVYEQGSRVSATILCD